MPPSRPALINILARIPQLGGQVRNIHDAWLRRRIDRYWRRDITSARKQFDASKPSLNEAQQRVVSDLNGCGIAQIHFNELFSETRLWGALLGQIQQWLQSEKIKERERRYIEGDYRETKWKEYIIMMTAEEGDTLSIDSHLLRLGLHSIILDIVNSYLGMMAKLFHVDVWKTIPSPRQGPLTGSQRWHRDPEDLKLVKVFLYLNDVGEQSGPLHYIKHSRRGDKHGQLWPQKLPYGSVAPPDEVERYTSRSDWAVCAGPAGTFVFADTTGLHMGGRSSAGERIFATWGYGGQGMVWPRYFKLDSTAIPRELSLAARHALFD